MFYNSGRKTVIKKRPGAGAPGLMPSPLRSGDVVPTSRQETPLARGLSAPQGRGRIAWGASPRNVPRKMSWDGLPTRSFRIASQLRFNMTAGSRRPFGAESRHKKASWGWRPRLDAIAASRRRRCTHFRPGNAACARAFRPAGSRAYSLGRQPSLFYTSSDFSAAPSPACPAGAEVWMAKRLSQLPYLLQFPFGRGWLRGGAASRENCFTVPGKLAGVVAKDVSNNEGASPRNVPRKMSWGWPSHAVRGGRRRGKAVPRGVFG